MNNYYSCDDLYDEVIMNAFAVFYRITAGEVSVDRGVAYLYRRSKPMYSIQYLLTQCMPSQIVSEYIEAALKDPKHTGTQKFLGPKPFSTKFEKNAYKREFRLGDTTCLYLYNDFAMARFGIEAGWSVSRLYNRLLVTSKEDLVKMRDILKVHRDIAVRIQELIKLGGGRLNMKTSNIVELPDYNSIEPFLSLDERKETI